MSHDSLFFFDMNHPDIYPEIWGMKEPFVASGAGYHLEIATSFRRRDGIGRALVTGWAMPPPGRRVEIRETHEQRAYTEREIVESLGDAGLVPVEVIDFDPYNEADSLERRRREAVFRLPRKLTPSSRGHILRSIVPSRFTPALKGDRMRRPTLVLLVVCALVLPATLFAQSQATTGVIEGIVTDASGAALPGVTVTIHNIDTNYTQTVVTDSGGRFRGVLLPLGKYDVTATLQGFSTSVMKGFDLGVGQTLTLPTSR